MSRVPRKLKATLVAGLVAVLVGAPTGVGYAAYQQDAAVRGLLPAGTVVGGVDVSNLDRTAAQRKVRAALRGDYDRPASVTVGGRTYTTTLRKLGIADDADAAVARAVAEASGGNWLTRAWSRLVDGSSAPSEDVTVTEHDPKKLAALVDKAVAEAAVAPRDAGVERAGGWLRFTPAVSGRSLDRTAVLAAFEASLKDGQPRTVEPTVQAPAKPTVDTAILVRAGENKLYLYKHGRLEKTYGVATGSPVYPTPTGRFEVTLKRYLPTWVNPWSKWSMNEPATIGPGPNNPLGTRALNINAPGIRIHGTPAWNSIGYSVSHGCIRMRMPDVEDLYPRVPTGTPVFIVQAAPHRVPGSATPVDTVADGG